MSDETKIGRLDEILRRLEGRIEDDGQWLEPHEIEAWRSLMPHIPELVKDLEYRHARRVVASAIRENLRQWYGVYLAICAVAAIYLQMDGNLREVIEWFANLKP